MPDFHQHAVTVPSPGAVAAQDTMVLGKFLRDVVKLNETERNFRIFGPDETLSNILGAVFEVTNRQWDAREVPNDEFLARSGLVLDSMLSEHQCEGWLEGYLLTGRHGLFNSYEAFIRIVDLMFSQHAKWLKVTRELAWRRPISSLNYLLASHVWQQDHNGFTHQDPGFLDHVINKKADIVRVYLPPDANCLLSVFDHCLRSRNYVNVVVAGKHALPQWLSMDAAVVHCTEGIGIWQWASNDQDSEPDVVMACCGDTPTLEILAAVAILRRASARIENSCDQRRRSDAAAIRERAPARPERPGLRLTLHQRQAHHLWVPWISVAGTPADLPPDQPQPSCPGLQGRGHHHDGLRYAGAERPGPLPSCAGRRGSRAGIGWQGRLPEADGSRQADRAQTLYRQARAGPAGDPELEVGCSGMNASQLAQVSPNPAAAAIAPLSGQRPGLLTTIT